jgi:signal transduction histidine kinase
MDDDRHSCFSRRKEEPHDDASRRPKEDTAMRTLTLASAMAGLILLCSAASAGAQQLGTAQEARAMLDRALVALKADQTNALNEFNDKSNKQFHENDLYVFCFSATNGNTVAHPNPALLGTDIRALKFKGDPFGQRVFDAAKGVNIATVDYDFPKPGTTEPVPKESFVTRVGNLACGVGYYK